MKGHKGSRHCVEETIAREHSWEPMYVQVQVLQGNLRAKMFVSRACAGPVRRQSSTQNLTVLGKRINLQSELTNQESIEHRQSSNILVESPSIVDLILDHSKWWSMLGMSLAAHNCWPPVTRNRLRSGITSLKADIIGLGLI